MAMMGLTQWEPTRNFGQLQDRINKVFTEAFNRGDEGLMNRGAWIPPVDIYQNGKELVLKAELPDMKREDIDITIEEHTLTIKGEKKLDTDVKDENVRRIERLYGSFTRSFTLPPTVDASNVSADYKDGVLTLRLPIREGAKPRQIHVKVAA
jgi:HSP20 family protein